MVLKLSLLPRFEPPAQPFWLSKALLPDNISQMQAEYRSADDPRSGETRPSEAQAHPSALGKLLWEGMQPNVIKLTKLINREVWARTAQAQ